MNNSEKFAALSAEAKNIMLSNDLYKANREIEALKSKLSQIKIVMKTRNKFKKAYPESTRLTDRDSDALLSINQIFGL